MGWGSEGSNVDPTELPKFGPDTVHKLIGSFTTIGFWRMINTYRGAEKDYSLLQYKLTGDGPQGVLIMESSITLLQSRCDTE